MAKAKRKQGHVRLTCPHCGRPVSVQRPQRFQGAVPCPNCRIPIRADLIAAAEADQAATVDQGAGAVTGGGVEVTAAAEETVDAEEPDSGSDQMPGGSTPVL